MPISEPPTDSVVEQPAPAAGGEVAQRDADADREDQRGDGQLDGAGEAAR